MQLSAVVSGAAQNLGKDFPEKSSTARVSALHLSVCHRSLEVSKYPEDEAELRNFSIFLFNCVFHLFLLTRPVPRIWQSFCHPCLMKFATEETGEE